MARAGREEMQNAEFLWPNFFQDPAYLSELFFDAAPGNMGMRLAQPQGSDEKPHVPSALNSGAIEGWSNGRRRARFSPVPKGEDGDVIRLLRPASKARDGPGQI